MRNGEYVEHTSSPWRFELKLLSPIVLARLGSHNAEYAIVPMVLNGGGSGWFYSINVFRNRHGTADQVVFADLGDRIGIDSIYVARDTISVDVITQGPHDAMADPTMPYTFRFLFRNDSLIQLNTH